MSDFDPIAALSVENVNVTWTAQLAGVTLNPTSPALGVQMAFPVSSGNPLLPAEPVTWYNGSWLAGTTAAGHIAQVLVGPTGQGGLVQLTAGLSYDVWSKVLGNPEVPAKYAGTIHVY